MTPETCPNCGTDIPRNARACPECGADEKTGWSEEAYVGGLNLPDESFEYNDFVEREFRGKQPIPHGVKWYWWGVAILLLAIFVGGFLVWLM